MIGCSNDKKLHPNHSFYHVPAIIKNEGEAAEILSAELGVEDLSLVDYDSTERILKNDKSMWIVVVILHLESLLNHETDSMKTGFQVYILDMTSQKKSGDF